MRPSTTLLVGAALALVAANDARADLANIDLSGKIYTKFMYKNDNTQGCLSLSNPFWVDNIGGSNGVCTEFELGVRGRIGKSVTAGVRIQSRWGALWQDWWENGDLKEVGLGSSGGDTSGESLGMNHAQYMKLRGAFVRFAPPIPTVRWVTVGSTDFSMWNEWTIGKARYIDRDNGNGVFIEGELLEEGKLAYTAGAMALPKLWAGPGWNTGLAANDPLAGLWGTDWAYGLKLESETTDELRMRLIGTLLQDWEADRYSPFLTGPPRADRDADHSVAFDTRFRGANATLDASYSPEAFEWMSLTGLLAASSNFVNPEYATNLVANGQGFSPVLFLRDSAGDPVAARALAGVVRAELSDPLEVGLSLRAEYFNLGSEYNAVMGARREADVLLTEGMITGGFIRGGQLPTLNVANEFVDWDEPWYESVIGWHGATGLVEYLAGTLKTTAEYTFITYNTNLQDRDTLTQYPDFLYTHGFTDPLAFTADMDYANKYDRGRDPRSVYTRWQERRTQIGVLNAQLPLPGGLPLHPVIAVKYKLVHDRDDRKLDNPADDYVGREHLGFGALSLQPTDELKVSLGYEYTHWDEAKRNGTQAGGFYDTVTQRHIGRAGLSYAFGGALFTYQLEYFHKHLDRDDTAYYDMEWNVWRSKGTFEVAF